MQPKPSLIETQKALATAVRLAHATFLIFPMIVFFPDTHITNSPK